MAVANASENPFTAIACETRRKLLDALRGAERTVTDLVEERAQGRFRFYRLKAKPLAEVMAWVCAYVDFWTGRLAALGRVLDDKT